MKPTISHRIIVVLIALALGGLLGYSAGEYEYRNGQPATPSGAVEKAATTVPARTFSLMVDYGNGKLSTFQDIPFTEGQTLLDILKTKFTSERIPFATKDYGSLGSLVTKIGSQENGVGGRYWQYWVNNRHPDVGAGFYKLKAGDVIEWKFISDQGQ